MRCEHLGVRGDDGEPKAGRAEIEDDKRERRCGRRGSRLARLTCRLCARAGGEYKNVIDDQVLLGLSAELFEVPHVAVPVDNLQDFSDGYSFVGDKRHPYYAFKDRLIREYLDNPITAGQLHYMRDGKIEWISGAVHMILRAEARATAILVILFIITSGAPGRGEEIATLLVRNMPGGSMMPFTVSWGATRRRARCSARTRSHHTL